MDLHFYLRLAVPFYFLHNVVLLIPNTLQTASRSPLQEASATRIPSTSMWRSRSHSISASSCAPERALKDLDEAATLTHACQLLLDTSVPDAGLRTMFEKIPRDALTQVKGLRP
ncbi:hypothetical protein ABH944_008328 [Caballeronia udeis]|uniref:Uncharacterized protein n=1 Tax=Caballeronia udeis TaxID=1232866 RepID=A0ABW8N0K8_9BURK